MASAFITSGLNMKEKHLFNQAYRYNLEFIKDYAGKQYLLIDSNNGVIIRTRFLKDIYITIKKEKKKYPVTSKKLVRSVSEDRKMNI